MNRNRNRIVEKLVDGDVVSEYESLTSAANQNNISLTTLHRYCKKGVDWRFKVDSIENEVWKNHPEINIECSTAGRIKLSTGKTTFGSIGKGGYMYVYPNNRTKLVARLIAETFIDNPDSKPTVDHIDRNRVNNNIANLRWATMLEQGQNKNPYTTNRKPYPPNRKKIKSNETYLLYPS